MDHAVQRLGLEPESGRGNVCEMRLERWSLVVLGSHANLSHALVKLAFNIVFMSLYVKNSFCSRF